MRGKAHQGYNALMAAPSADKLHIAGQMLLSFDAGASITLILAVCAAAQIFPEMTDYLLRPGSYFAEKLGATGVGATILSVVGDGIVYGALFFFLVRLRSWGRKSRREEHHLSLIGTPAHEQPQTERRRATRSAISMPVFAYGYVGDEPFSENTETLNISAVGGLMLLGAKVALSQQLILINAQSDEELACRVVRALRTPAGNTVVAVEFPHESANFWQPEAALAAANASTAGVVTSHAQHVTS
jgi:hypothetical protein